MRWGKFLLLFQAVVTLIFGIIFLLSFLSLDNLGLSTFSTSNVGDPSELVGSYSESIDSLKSRFISATYILLVVAVFEVLLIARFVGS